MKKKSKVSRMNVDANNIKKGMVVINSNEKEVSKNNERSVIISLTNRDELSFIPGEDRSCLAADFYYQLETKRGRCQ